MYEKLELKRIELELERVKFEKERSEKDCRFRCIEIARMVLGEEKGLLDEAQKIMDFINGK